MSKPKPMTKTAAARIQSANAKSSPNGNVSKGSFAAKAQSVAVKNSSN